MFWRDKTVLCKVETIYGVDSNPTAAANALLLTDVNLLPMEGQDVSRNLELPYMGAQSTIPVDLHQKLSFKIEVKGSGNQTPGTPPAFGPILRACSMAEVIVAGTSVTYNKITANPESVTFYVNISGTLYKMLGARGTATYAMAPSGIVYLECEMTGLWVMPEDQVKPTPSIISQLTHMPQVASPEYVPTLSIGDWEPKARTFSLNMGNTVSLNSLINHQEVIIENQEELISMDVRAVPLGEYNPYVAAKTGVLQDIELVHGVGAGRITTLTVPMAQQQRASGIGQQTGIVEWPLRFSPLPNLGGDQFTLAFT